MALWTLLVWLVIGAAAGLLARKIIGGNSPFGTIGDIILGCAGGVVGGYILAMAGAAGTAGIVGSFIAALLGALLLIWSAGKLKSQ
ncbi:MAG: GlsB/YeaQ/YmgE family stress response membrane protein [Gammaproteobacteria bacterium]